MEKFSPKEIVAIAVEVEENGRKFYAAMAKTTKEDKLKNMWQFLQEQEEAHKKCFSEILENIDEFVVKDYTGGDYDNYMSALSSGFIFTRELISKKIKEKFLSQKDALDFAIGIEKESILTYYELKDYILPKKQSYIDQIIEEEKNHLTELTLMKDKIGPRINQI